MSHITRGRRDDDVSLTTDMHARYQQDILNLQKTIEEEKKANAKLLQSFIAIKSEANVVYGLEYSGFELWNRLDNIYKILIDVIPPDIKLKVG